MLITIGQKPSAARDLVDLLLECHERIRSFVALARAAAEEADPPETEIVEACFRVERYFVEALPLHVADEEESVLPRLGGRSLEIDRALHAMHEQHIGHERKLRSLLNASAALRQSPSDVRRRAVLAVAASDLGQDLTEHLALEEAVVFPHDQPRATGGHASGDRGGASRTPSTRRSAVLGVQRTLTIIRRE